MGTSGKKQPQNNLFKVNLLLNKNEQVKLQVKLLKWVLSSGRFIVVFVELIVIMAFVYRYKLDGDLADIQEKINEQVPYIESLKNDEILIRETQFQLSTIKQIKSSSPDFPQVLVKLSELTPKTIRLTGISFDRSQVLTRTTMSITGQTPSNLELSAYIKALQKEPTFTEISLTNISFEGQTTFTITGSISTKGGKTS